MAASAVCRTDHPRACGANFVLSVSGLALCGSSPRVRGKPDCGFIAVKSVRIIPARAGQTKSIAIGGGVLLRTIPARAGQTSKTGRQYLRMSDHPRACGANSRSSAGVMSPNGSSPRVRGKHRDDYVFCHGLRIIPARAGQTAATS